MSNETDKAFAAARGDDPLDGRGPTAGPEELPSAEWTTDQVEQWKEAASKGQEHWERLVRVSADFDNYKKRAARERQEAIRFANESVLQKLVPILDNLEMALGATNSAQGASSEALKTGVNMIHSQLRNVLADAGLEEIDAVGKLFDPNWHEAVSQQVSESLPEGQVMQQIRKGFKLNDRLLRPASVVVAKKPST